MNELKYLQAIDFEINLGCPLAGLHSGICPITDPDRWKKLDRTHVMANADIIASVDEAYNQLGFRGWILWHYFNDPILGLDRLEQLVPQLRKVVPQARLGFFTSGEKADLDLARLKIFDKVWWRNYLSRGTSAVRASHPNLIVDPAPVLDARMTTPPRLNNRKRCRRMWDELAFDFYGHAHICTGDWRGEVRLGNIQDGLFPIVQKYLTIRDTISQQPMALDAPAFCQNCALSMRDGDCIIDEPLFKEITIYRGF
jgi:hypothetical protein